jgi:predicted kinase
VLSAGFGFAKALEGELMAMHLSADEWMEALSLDLYDQTRRAKVETLQWQIGQQLLSRGLTIIME